MGVPPGVPSWLRRIGWAEVTLAGLMIAIAAPVWLLPYLPMQDYPEHLFQAKLVAAWLTGGAIDPAYQVHLHATYSLFYLLVFGFSQVMPLAAAGRAAISLYFVGMYVAARRVLWIHGSDQPPAAAAFLLAPLAVNHAYYLGFVNYLYALPLLLIGLTQLLAALRAGWTGRSATVHAALLAALLLCNAIALAMYLAVVGTWLLLRLGDRAARRRIALSLAVALACAVAWMVAAAMHAGPGDGIALHWLPLWRNATFYLMGFTGYRLADGPHVGFLLLWVAAAIVATGAVRWATLRHRHGLLLSASGAAILLLVTLLGPFRAGAVAFVSPRAAEGSYLCLVLAAAMVAIPRRFALALGVAAGLLVALTIGQEARVSAETATLKPLIALMAPGAAVYPQMIAPGSPELESYVFEPHLHDVYYYHLARGGVSPYLFPARSASATPVSFAPGFALPAPPEDDPKFYWEVHGGAYRYVLTRGGNGKVFAYLRLGGDLRGVSGEWQLYERKTQPPPKGRPLKPLE